MDQVKKRLEQLENGLITLEELNIELSKLYIYGAVRDNNRDQYGFIGYDYLRQEWIDIK